MPLSMTEMRTWEPEFSLLTLMRGARSAGTNFRAFVTRFQNTWRSVAGCATACLAESSIVIEADLARASAGGKPMVQHEVDDNAGH